MLMSPLALALSMLALHAPATRLAPSSDPNVVYSPYNWYQSDAFAQSANRGSYFKLGFTGSQLSVEVDVNPLVSANVPADQYPVVRFSVDGGPATTMQLGPDSHSIVCAKGLPGGTHDLLFQYVAGYVFLDFWSPVNVLRV